jgi:tetratricopeptide (TPR) repeat protein
MPPGSRDSLTGLPRARQSTPLPSQRGATPRPSLPDVSTLDNDGKFRRVELLCQRNAWNDALPIIRSLLDEDKRNAKYLGMLSHVLYGRTTDANFPKELVDSVNQALRIDADEVHALYTKARCYKRLGKEREALHYFRRTLGVDPNHLDAAREARLLVSRLAERKKR